MAVFVRAIRLAQRHLAVSTRRLLNEILNRRKIGHLERLLDREVRVAVAAIVNGSNRMGW